MDFDLKSGSAWQLHTKRPTKLSVYMKKVSWSRQSNARRFPLALALGIPVSKGRSLHTYTTGLGARSVLSNHIDNHNAWGREGGRENPRGGGGGGGGGGVGEKMVGNLSVRLWGTRETDGWIWPPPNLLHIHNIYMYQEK